MKRSNFFFHFHDAYIQQNLHALPFKKCCLHYLLLKNMFLNMKSNCEQQDIVNSLLTLNLYHFLSLNLEQNLSSSWKNSPKVCYVKFKKVTNCQYKTQNFGSNPPSSWLQNTLSKSSKYKKLFQSTSTITPRLQHPLPLYIWREVKTAPKTTWYLKINGLDDNWQLKLCKFHLIEKVLTKVLQN